MEESEREGASLPQSCNILDTTQKLVSIELSEPKIIINVSTTIINIANIPTEALPRIFSKFLS